MTAIQYECYGPDMNTHLLLLRHFIVGLEFHNLTLGTFQLLNLLENFLFFLERHAHNGAIAFEFSRREK
jgi:hypothetical protein